MNHAVSKTTEFGLGLSIRPSSPLVFNTGGCRHLEKAVHPGQQYLASKGHACHELEAIEEQAKFPTQACVGELSIPVNLTLLTQLRDALSGTACSLERARARVSAAAFRMGAALSCCDWSGCENISIGTLARGWGQPTWMLGHWEEYYAKGDSLLPLPHLAVC